MKSIDSSIPSPSPYPTHHAQLHPRPFVSVQVVDAGMRVMRINFSHATFEEAEMRLANLRAVSRDAVTAVPSQD